MPCLFLGATGGSARKRDVLAQERCAGGRGGFQREFWCPPALARRRKRAPCGDERREIRRPLRFEAQLLVQRRVLEAQDEGVQRLAGEGGRRGECRFLGWGFGTGRLACLAVRRIADQRV